MINYFATATTTALLLQHNPAEVAFFRLLHDEFHKAVYFIGATESEFALREQRLRHGIQIYQRQEQAWWVATTSSSQSLSSSSMQKREGVQPSSSSSLNQPAMKASPSGATLNASPTSGTTTTTPFAAAGSADSLSCSLLADKWQVMAKSIYRLYKDLLLLETFCIMTVASFSKILKKHDKVTGQVTREAFMQNVVLRHQNLVEYPTVVERLARIQTMYNQVAQVRRQQRKQQRQRQEQQREFPWSTVATAAVQEIPRVRHGRRVGRTIYLDQSEDDDEDEREDRQHNEASGGSAATVDEAAGNFTEEERLFLDMIHQIQSFTQQHR
jgi:SPX domain